MTSLRRHHDVIMSVVLAAPRPSVLGPGPAFSPSGRRPWLYQRVETGSRVDGRLRDLRATHARSAPRTETEGRVCASLQRADSDAPPQCQWQRPAVVPKTVRSWTRCWRNHTGRPDRVGHADPAASLRVGEKGGPAEAAAIAARPGQLAASITSRGAERRQMTAQRCTPLCLPLAEPASSA